MITAEEAKRIADNVRLKKKYEAEANVDCFLSTLYEIIKEAADKGQYAKTIALGIEVDKDIYLVSNKDDVIPISLECLEKKLHSRGFRVKTLKSSYDLGDYTTISW